MYWRMEAVMKKGKWETLFISDINGNDKKGMLKTIYVYTGITIFCGVFSYIYSRFSHGVFSNYMTFMFLFPFLLGIVVNLYIMLMRSCPMPGSRTRSLYNQGVATLTVGSVVKGITDIAGTATQYQNVFWIAGIVLIVAGLISYIIDLRE